MLPLDQLRLVPGVQLLGHYRNVSAAESLPVHEHTLSFEICYLARGRQMYRVGGRDYAMSAGDIYFTFPGEWHSTGSQPQEKGELYWMQVQSRHPQLLNLPRSLSRPLLKSLHDLPARHFPASDQVRSLFPQLFALAADSVRSAPSAVVRLELSTLATQLLLAVARSGALPNDEGGRPDMNTALRYIRDHLEGQIGVPELAGVTGLSESWFKARFRQAIGMPPGEYILREKIARARQFLLAGESVTSTAHRVGFSSSQYFATVFKRFTGRTPRDVVARQ